MRVTPSFLHYTHSFLNRVPRTTCRLTGRSQSPNKSTPFVLLRRVVFIYHSFPTNSGQPIITVTQMGNLIAHFESSIFNLRDTMSIAVSPYFPFTALGWRIQCAVGEPHLSHIVSNHFWIISHNTCAV